MGDRIVRLDPEWTVARFRDCGHVTHACCEAHTLGECDKCAEGAGVVGFTFARVDRSGWVRWVEGGDHAAYMHAAGPDDGTAEHWIYGGYDDRCGWCYLGATHTEAAHDRSVGRPR